MIHFRYSSVECYLLPASGGRGLLAYDAGWPCSLHDYARAMKATGFRLGEIRWAMVSHFHLDHAGLVRDFQDAGIECLLFENQGGGIDEMERLIVRGHKDYRPILKDRFRRLRLGESRAFLAELGIRGEALATPGHSDDSVSLVLDDGDALVGDLPPASQVMPDDEASLSSWRRIRELGGLQAWPSHAPPFRLDETLEGDG